MDHLLQAQFMDLLEIGIGEVILIALVAYIVALFVQSLIYQMAYKTVEGTKPPYSRSMLVVFLSGLLSIVAAVILGLIASPMQGTEFQDVSMTLTTVFPLIAVAFMYGWMTRCFFKVEFNKAVGIALVMMALDFLLDVVLLGIVFGIAELAPAT
ncbi:MAG: hypothetical protein MK101_11485 [Phycisphaerales bacterium]|nr:hypothetical protein [Phycisphaerales bacterium]